MLDIFFYYSLLLVLALSAYLLHCAGALYIGLEGTFVWTVFSCFYFLYLELPLYMVVIGSCMSSGIFLFIFYILHFFLKINENFVGILINVCVWALLDSINRLGFQRKGILFFGNPIENLYLYRYLAVIFMLLSCFVVAYTLLKTPWGLRLRMASTPRVWKKERGLCAHCDNFYLFTVSSLLITGAAITLVISLNAYTLNLGSGMGWLALFALLLGFNRLIGITFSCGFLALALTLSYTWQESLGFYKARGLPYLSCFIAYLLISAWRARFKKKNIYRFS